MATSRPAQHVFRNDADLLEWLTSRIDGHLPHLIAVDGITGTGKSRLSRSLGEALSCPTIDCDDFIRDGKRFYPALLDLDELSRTLRGALGAIGEPLLTASYYSKYSMRSTSRRPPTSTFDIIGRLIR